MSWIVAMLESLKEPVLMPAVISGLMWAVQRWTNLLLTWPDWAKRAAMVVVGAVLGFVGQRFGIDVSSVSGAAASLVAMGIFYVGKVGRS